MSYTSEDIAWAQAELRNYLRADEGDGKHRRMEGIVSAALRWASGHAERAHGTGYTSDDYRWLAALLDSGSAAIEHPTPTVARPAAARLAAAALRIAAKIAEPGVIELSLVDWLEEEGETWTVPRLGSAIRAALQKDTG